MKKRFTALLLVAVMLMATLAACADPSAQTPGTSTASGATSAPATSAAPDAGSTEPQRVTLYPLNAGLQSGPVVGWLGDYLLENGIILEVIPFSDEKTQAMLASGDLADIVIFSKLADALAAMDAGMIINFDEHLDKLPHIANDPLYAPALSFVREYRSNDTGKLSFIPYGVGKNAIANSADSDRHAIKMNYEVYESIGAPSFETLEDVIPILQQMQAAFPKTEEDINTYGMHLFSDFDTNQFYNMISILPLFGYQVDFLSSGVEYNTITGEGRSIFTDDSMYKRAAKFFNSMNRAGLLDPDSLTQDRVTANKKVDAGAALAGWGGVPGWTSQGYLPVSFDEFYPAFSIQNPYGSIGYTVSTKAESIDACLKLIDMLADPEALLTIYNGPQGERWDYDANGKVVSTEKYLKSLEEGNKTFTLESGEEFALFNIAAYVRGFGEISETYGEPYPLSMWKESVERSYSKELPQKWSERYGYPYLMEQLKAENRLTAVADNSYIPMLTPDDDEMKLNLAVLKDTIVPGTWELVYAKDDAEFESIWNSMKQKCEDLGIQSVVDFKLADIAAAKDLAKALQS